MVGCRFRMDAFACWLVGAQHALHLKYLILTLKWQVETEFTHSLPQIISPHEIAAHHLDIFIYMFHHFHIFSHDFPIFPISPRLSPPFPARLHHEAAIRATAGLGEQLLRKPGDCGFFWMGFSAEIAADLEIYYTRFDIWICQLSWERVLE